MGEKVFTVLDLLSLNLKGHEDLRLKCIAGRRGLVREIMGSEVNRPGLVLSGFYEAFVPKHVQLMGTGESAYLQKLYAEDNTTSVQKFLEFDIPCIVFSNMFPPPQKFLAIADEVGCPILQTSLTSSEFAMRLMRVFSMVFAPQKTIHGVLVEVFGIGILLTGDAGIGKSECALELVERGHRLVADDIINLRCINGNTILGQGTNIHISHHMEIRGLGIMNVAQLYGVSRVCEQKEIQLLINLEVWDKNKAYDRIGSVIETQDILGVKIPSFDVPVKPGRNLPIIIEVAAMNMRLRAMGYNSALDFNQNVLRWIEADQAQTAYYGSDDSY